MKLIAWISIVWLIIAIGCKNKKISKSNNSKIKSEKVLLESKIRGNIKSSARNSQSIPLGFDIPTSDLKSQNSLKPPLNELSEELKDLPKKLHEKYLLYSKNKLPGIAIAVIKNNTLIVKNAFGMASIEDNKLNSISTPFRIASNSKQITATAAAIAMDKGYLKFRDPIDLFLPELPGSTSDITVGNLIHHTSGFSDYYDDLCSYKPGSKVHNNDVTKWLALNPHRDFIDGNQFGYSNTGYNILATVIGVGAKLPYYDFIRKEIFIPLGMQDSFLYSEKPNELNRAIGYSQIRGKNVINDFDTCDELNGEGGVFASIRDYVMWVHALQIGALINDKGIVSQLMSNGHFNNGEPINNRNEGYGYGWFIKENSNFGKMVFHYGVFMGYLSLSTYYPDKDNSWVVVLANSDSIDVDSIADELTEEFIK